MTLDQVFLLIDVWPHHSHVCVFAPGVKEFAEECTVPVVSDVTEGSVRKITLRSGFSMIRRLEVEGDVLRVYQREVRPTAPTGQQAKLTCDPWTPRPFAYLPIARAALLVQYLTVDGQRKQRTRCMVLEGKTFVDAPLNRSRAFDPFLARARLLREMDLTRGASEDEGAGVAP